MSASGKTLPLQSLVPVAVRTLTPADVCQFDLYLCVDKSDRPRLYRERTYPLTQTDIQRLFERGIRTLYISSADASRYCDHLCENVVNDKRLPPLHRYQILREATQAVLSEALQDGDVDNAIKVTGNIGQHMVETVCNQKTVLFDLFQVMTHDYTTFAHAMNVSTYCLLLADRVGIHDREELIAIGQGALLHDIGKRHVPVQVLQKAGQLTAWEKEQVKQHVTRGFRELCRRDDVSWGQLMMIYQHHERYDGQGYPTGLVRSEIHEYGRLCAIADVFDALTRDRPYRKASLTADVLAYLDRQAGRGFDEEMVLCWIAAINK